MISLFVFISTDFGGLHSTQHGDVLSPSVVPRNWFRFRLRSSDVENMAVRPKLHITEIKLGLSLGRSTASQLTIRIKMCETIGDIYPFIASALRSVLMCTTDPSVCRASPSAAV